MISANGGLPAHRYTPQVTRRWPRGSEPASVDYGEVNKKTQNHSGSIPNMKNNLERIAKCRYKTKMDKRSGFWQVDLTAAAQELLAFITPKGCVFKWKVMPFGVANAPALFQELMKKFCTY